MLPLLPPAPCKPLAEEECTKLFIDFGKTTRLVGRSCEPIEKQEACSSKLRSNRKTRGLQFEAPIQSKTRCLQLDAAIHSETRGLQLEAAIQSRNKRLAARRCDPIEAHEVCNSKARSDHKNTRLAARSCDPIETHEVCSSKPRSALKKHEVCNSKLRSNRKNMRSAARSWDPIANKRFAARSCDPIEKRLGLQFEARGPWGPREAFTSPKSADYVRKWPSGRPSPAFRAALRPLLGSLPLELPHKK